MLHYIDCRISRQSDLVIVYHRRIIEGSVRPCHPVFGPRARSNFMTNLDEVNVISRLKGYNGLAPVDAINFFRPLAAIRANIDDDRIARERINVSKVFEFMFLPVIKVFSIYRYHYKCMYRIRIQLGESLRAYRYNNLLNLQTIFQNPRAYIRADDRRRCPH